MVDTDVRLENLLGAVALAIQDRVRPAIEATVGQRGAAAAALVHLASYPGESIEQLCRVLRVSQPGTVAIVDRLVTAGLVERRPGPDRRTHALHVTEAGTVAADQILAERRRPLTQLLASLAPDERAHLRSALEKLVAGLASDRPQARTVCRLCDRDACCSGPGCPLDHTVSDGKR
ncbi:MAG: MarR family transcriptional regulator [Pseudonocardiales bacterium]|nr:MarR family transcriptional regulator [Pseudonocardiales bacterium]